MGREPEGSDNKRGTTTREQILVGDLLEPGDPTLSRPYYPELCPSHDIRSNRRTGFEIQKVETPELCNLHASMQPQWAL